MAVEIEIEIDFDKRHCLRCCPRREALAVLLTALDSGAVVASAVDKDIVADAVASAAPDEP